MFNGFGGLSSQVLEELKDEYGSKSFLTFGVAPTQFPDGTHKDTAYRILNSALSYGNLSQHSDLFIPLSLACEAWPRMRQAREFPLLTYKVSYVLQVFKYLNCSSYHRDEKTAVLKHLWILLILVL